MSTFYEEVGGTEFFEELVSGFYAVVAVDPILAPMYPDKDWHAAAQRLQMFLEQYWAGQPHIQKNVGIPGYVCVIINFLLIQKRKLLG